MNHRIGSHCVVSQGAESGNNEDGLLETRDSPQQSFSSHIAKDFFSGLPTREVANPKKEAFDRNSLFERDVVFEVPESWLPSAEVIEHALAAVGSDEYVTTVAESWIPGPDVMSDARLACRLSASVKRNNPRVLGVGLGETLSVDIPLGEAKTLLTRGLHRNRYSALVILSKRPDGKRSCTLSHHPTASADQQMALVREVLLRHATGRGDAEHKMFIITPEKQGEQLDGDSGLDAPVSIEIRMNRGQKKRLTVQPTVLRYVADANIHLPRECILHIPSEAELPIILCGDSSRSTVI